MNRHDQRDRYRPRTERPDKKGWGFLRVLTVVGIGCLAAVLFLRTGGNTDRVITPPGPVKLARMVLSPKKLVWVKTAHQGS